MNVHIIRSPEVDLNFFMEVGAILTNIKGLINFKLDEEAVEDFKSLTEKDEDFDEHVQVFESMKHSRAIDLKNFTVSWEDIFKKCDTYARQKDLGNKEIVVLVTNISNKHNWFVGGDEETKNHFFVHSGDWDMFIECEKKFPVAYHIAFCALAANMFDDYKEVMQHGHRVGIGCMMDLCPEKKDVILKLRTGDICTSCLDFMKSKNIATTHIKQVFDVFDSIRSQMLFMRRVSSTLSPSRITIEGYQQKIYLVDLNNQEVHLTPLEKTVWLFFLNHPEGVTYPNIIEHRDELEKIYKKLSVASNLAAMRNNIDRLCDPLDNDSLRQKISRLNAKFKNAVGKDMAKYYQIKGDKGGAKRIEVDRGMVTYIES